MAHRPPCPTHPKHLPQATHPHSRHMRTRHRLAAAAAAAACSYGSVIDCLQACHLHVCLACSGFLVCVTEEHGMHGLPWRPCPLQHAASCIPVSSCNMPALLHYLDLIIYECAPVYKPAGLPTTAGRIPTTAIPSSGLCTTGSVRTTRCLSTPAAWRLSTCTCTWSIPTCARQAGHAALEQQLEAACMIALVPQTSGRRTQQRGICDWRYVCGAPHFAILII